MSAPAADPRPAPESSPRSLAGRVDALLALFDEALTGEEAPVTR